MAENDNSTVFTLKDFTECFIPPRTFKVVGGTGLNSNSHTTALCVGDSIYVHTLAVEWICLSFYDTDTGVKREVKVPPDSPIKFNIVHKSRQTFDRIFTTVADLLETWPTRFQANYGRDDPYLPHIFKKGEQFTFIRKCRNPDDRKLYLQCEDESGHVITLPSNCRGDFTVLEDQRSFTLQEIVALGESERILRFSEDNLKLIAANNQDNEPQFYTNVGNNEDILTKLTGLPLTYNGLFTMQLPKFYVIVSPQDNHDLKWKVSIDADIQVMDQFEEYLPPSRDMPLKEFVDTFELDLPVIARVSSYNTNTSHFLKHIFAGTEVIVHRVDKNVDRILASTKSDLYCLGSDVSGRFRKYSRRFNSVQKVLDTREKIKLKVCEEIACDVPEPFCLRCGDILKCTNFSTQDIKIRFGKKVYGECQVVQWDVLEENGERRVIKLPIDLEVTLQEIDEDDGFDIANILQYRADLPMHVFSLQTNDFVMVDEDIKLEHYVSDPLVLISTIPRQADTKQTCLDAKIDMCFMVPLRHDLVLHLRERLHFPPSYFILPRRKKWLSTGAEKISREVYNDLLQFNDQAYEDYQCRAENTEIAQGSTKLVDRMKDEVRSRMSKLSLKMSWSSSQLSDLDRAPDTRRKESSQSQNIPHIRRTTSFPSETNIPGVSNSLYDEDLCYNDENIYEDYHHSMSQKNKTKQSVGRKLLRRISRRGKR